MSGIAENTLAAAWCVIVAATVSAAVLDVRKFTVPNALTVPLCVLGVIYHTVVMGYGGLRFSVVGAVVGFLLLVFFFLIGAMGAGDVKLLAGVGAWLGVSSTLSICLIACIAAGLYSVGVCVIRGRHARLAPPLRVLLAPFRTTAEPEHGRQTVDVAVKGDDRRWRVMPFAVMIAIGVLLAATREYGSWFLCQGHTI